MESQSVERDLAAVAERLATAAHDGQRDKAGAAYITHPRRVAARLAGQGPLAVAVGWLHDVLEDTAVTRKQLATAGIPERALTAIDALTHRPDEDRDAYYARVAADPLARTVKAADIADNADPERLALLPADTRRRLEAKYAHAQAVLGLSVL